MSNFRAVILVFGVFMFIAACGESSVPQVQQSTKQDEQLPKHMVLDLGIDKVGNRVTIRLVLISPGKFLMGSSETEQGRDQDEQQHEVTISKPFYMGVYEVTVDQYQHFAQETVRNYEEPDFPQSGDHPMVNVTWKDAQNFCRWASTKTGRKVMLPTEAQWEYACRAGTSTQFCFGDRDEELHQYGNYCDKSNTDEKSKSYRDKDHDDGHDKTAAVGSLKPNAWGLYDMHGNVWEWCSDWYDHGYDVADKMDPKGPGSGRHRVVRGGAWFNPTRTCRSADRSSCPPDRTFNNGVGFRIVVSTDSND